MKLMRRVEPEDKTMHRTPLNQPLKKIKSYCWYQPPAQGILSDMDVLKGAKVSIFSGVPSRK